MREGNLTWKAKVFNIPIYDVKFGLVLTSEPERFRQRKSVKALFGEYRGPAFDAMTCSSTNDYLIIIKVASHRNIAHEVFHATHRIMEACSHELTTDSHEPHCYLAGHLTELVYRQLKAWKVRVK